MLLSLLVCLNLAFWWMDIIYWVFFFCIKMKIRLENILHWNNPYNFYQLHGSNILWQPWCSTSWSSDCAWRLSSSEVFSFTFALPLLFVAYSLLSFFSAYRFCKSAQGSISVRNCTNKTYLKKNWKSNNFSVFCFPLFVVSLIIFFCKFNF
jgi:hypothetical protein